MSSSVSNNPTQLMALRRNDLTESLGSGTTEIQHKHSWLNICKTYPDGNTGMLKVIFCCRGDQQVHGI